MAGTAQTLQKSCPSKPVDETRKQLNQLITDFDILVASYNSLLAKLDLDAGVTGVDYATTVPGAVTTAKPTNVL